MNKARNAKIKAAVNIYDFLEEIIMLFAIHLALYLVTPVFGENNGLMGISFKGYPPWYDFSKEGRDFYKQPFALRRKYSLVMVHE